MIYYSVCATIWANVPLVFSFLPFFSCVCVFFSINFPSRNVICLCLLFVSCPRIRNLVGLKKKEKVFQIESRSIEKKIRKYVGGVVTEFVNCCVIRVVTADFFFCLTASSSSFKLSLRYIYFYSSMNITLLSIKNLKEELVTRKSVHNILNRGRRTVPRFLRFSYPCFLSNSPKHDFVPLRKVHYV